MFKDRLAVIRVLFVSIFFQFATGCVTSATADLPYVPGKRHRLTILHTNDTHGRFWKSKDGAYGFPAQATLIKRIREEVAAAGGHVLLLSGGDVNTGTPASDLLDAEPDFKAMRRMGYDAMALGNHEFDNDRVVLDRQAGWAGFPFLAANIYEEGTHRRAFTPYIIEDLDGLKIAILGLTTEETSVIANKKYVEAYDFRSAIEEAKELVPRLDEKAALVIALTHLGYYGQDETARPPGDVALARAVAGIDVIVGGHEHLALAKPDADHGAIIVQAGEGGKYLGRLDLEFQDGQLMMTGYRLLPVNFQGQGKDADAETIPDDPEVLAFLKPFFDRTSVRLQAVIATVDSNFFGQSRDRETNLGRLVAGAIREATQADVAVMNNGGLRVDWKKGPVTYGDLLELLPFGSSLCSAELNGRELRSYLEHVLNGSQTGHFANVRIQMRRQNGKRIPVSVRVGGKPVLDVARYRMASNCFSLAGGDRYPDLSVLPSFKDQGIRDADAVLSFLKRRGALVRGKDFAMPSVQGP